MILVYTTCKGSKEAKKIASHLLKKKLIGCANFFPISSSYKWKNKIVNDREYALLCKTKKPFKAVEGEIKKIHSYEIPCIIKINASANKEFLRWL